MRESPIRFTDPMVRAILDGSKTQTRRVITEKVIGPNAAGKYVARDGSRFFVPGYYARRPVRERGRLIGHREPFVTCPYGDPGDRLWVRETWRPLGPLSECAGPDDIRFAATAEEADLATATWRPSIHMPRWASRLTLEIAGIRLERLQAITEEDARAEGVEPKMLAGAAAIYDTPAVPSHTHGFALLWDTINGKRKGADWDANPWVWVVEFRRVEQAATP